MRYQRRINFAWILLLFQFLPSPSWSAEQPVTANEIWVLNINGVINPLSARYLKTHIDAVQKGSPRSHPD